MNDYLERFDLAAHRKKKVKELSKGMQQKAQLHRHPAAPARASDCG